MPSLCQNFGENAWRKDLCSNCFKSKAEHNQGNASAQADEHALSPVADSPRMVVSFREHQLSESVLNGPDLSTKPKSILRMTVSNPTSGQKERKVDFKAEAIEIIGYGGDDVAEVEDSASSPSLSQPESDDEAELGEAEMEWQRETRKNTLFNSAKQNLLGGTVKAFTTHGMSNMADSPASTGNAPKPLFVEIRPFGQTHAAPPKVTSNLFLSKKEEQLHGKPFRTITPLVVTKSISTTSILPESLELPKDRESVNGSPVASDGTPPALPTTPPPALEALKVAKAAFLHEVLEEECPKAKLMRKPPILKEKPKIFVKLSRSDSITVDSDQESGIDSPSPSSEEILQPEDNSGDVFTPLSNEFVRTNSEDHIQALLLPVATGQPSSLEYASTDHSTSSSTEEAETQEKSALERLNRLFIPGTNSSSTKNRPSLPLVKTHSAPPVPSSALTSSPTPVVPQRQKALRSPSFRPVVKDSPTSGKGVSWTPGRDSRTDTPTKSANFVSEAKGPAKNSVVSSTDSSKRNFESARASIAESLAFHRLQTRASSGKRQAPLPPKVDSQVGEKEDQDAVENENGTPGLDPQEKLPSPNMENTSLPTFSATESPTEKVPSMGTENIPLPVFSDKESKLEPVSVAQGQTNSIVIEDVMIPVQEEPVQAVKLYSSFKGDRSHHSAAGSTLSLDSMLPNDNVTYNPFLSHDNWTANEDRQPRSLSLTRVDDSLPHERVTPNSKPHVSMKSMLKQKASSIFTSTPVASNKSRGERTPNGRVSRADWRNNDKKEAKEKGSTSFIRRWFKIGTSSNNHSEEVKEQAKTRPTIVHPLDFHAGNVQVVADAKQTALTETSLGNLSSDPLPNAIYSDCSQSFSSDTSCETSTSGIHAAELALESKTSLDGSLQWQSSTTNSSGRPKPPPPPRVYSLETGKPNRPPRPNTATKASLYANLGDVRQGFIPKKPERSASMRILSDAKENNYEQIIPKSKQHMPVKEHVTDDGYIIPGSIRAKSERLRPGPHRHSLISFVSPTSKDQESSSPLNSLESSYGAVTEANRMALTKILDHNANGCLPSKEYSALKESEIRWSDFESVKRVFQEDGHVWAKGVCKGLPVFICIQKASSQVNMPPFDFVIRPITHFEDYVPADLWSLEYGRVDVFAPMHLVKLVDIQTTESRLACELGLLQMFYTWEWAEQEHVTFNPDHILFTATESGDYRTVLLRHRVEKDEASSGVETTFASYLHKLRVHINIVNQLPVNLGLESCKNALEFLLFGPNAQKDIDSLEEFERWVNLNRAQTLHDFICSRGFGPGELRLEEQLRMSFLLRACPATLLQSHHILNNLL